MRYERRSKNEKGWTRRKSKKGGKLKQDEDGGWRKGIGREEVPEVWP